jgi:hypothetical protein
MMRSDLDGALTRHCISSAFAYCNETPPCLTCASECIVLYSRLTKSLRLLSQYTRLPQDAHQFMPLPNRISQRPLLEPHPHLQQINDIIQQVRLPHNGSLVRRIVHAEHMHVQMVVGWLVMHKASQLPSSLLRRGTKPEALVSYLRCCFLDLAQQRDVGGTERAERTERAILHYAY